MGDPEDPKETGGVASNKLSGDKPQDYQIRLKIVQAHQLSGSSNVSPFCRVTVAGTSRQTRVQSFTTSPEWDESIIINTRKSPTEMATTNINFEVVDQKGTFSSNVVIGSFSLPASQVYAEPKHGLLNKWLFLTDPSDGSTHTGYLRMSVAILGPGDAAPTFPALADLGSDENEDIEKNLLKSQKAATTPAELVCRIYSAEDLPQMDPSELMESMKKFFGSKPKEVDHVDPYVFVKFGGKFAKTVVRETCMSPKWNQQIIANIQLPCVSDRLSIVLRDYDRVGDDEIIGSFNISFRDITLNGEGGFPVTFGPTWINFYGSPREYSLTNSLKMLDEGKGEGVAFRGRAFVEFFVRPVVSPGPELKPEPTEQDSLKVTYIDAEEVAKIGAFNKRRKFRLLAVVYDAGWLPTKDGPVEIEVSVGLCGDKIDKHSSPSSSTTAPAMPRFDGSSYYYLPHLSSSSRKRCLMVDAPFEDSAFRLETINYFENAARLVENGIARYESNASTDSDALKSGSLRQILRQLEEFLSANPLPKAKQDTTELDNHLHKHRMLAIGEILKDMERIDQALENAKTEPEDRDECFATTLKELKAMPKNLRKLSVELQNSFPDVFVWIIREMKRFAYARIPTASLYLSRNTAYTGHLAGQLQTIEFKHPSAVLDSSDKSTWTLPGMMRARFWFCTDNRFDEWFGLWPKSSISFYAEVYENQVKPKFSPSWISAKGGSDKRPACSDESGELDLGDRKTLLPPANWQWDDDWTLSTDLINLYQTDDEKGQSKVSVKDKVVVDEVFEVNKRTADNSWVRVEEMPFMSISGQSVPPPNDGDSPPAGWIWEKPAVWKVDAHRACDDEGWDYGETLLGPWEPVEKWYLKVRRRKWIRKRVLANDVEGGQVKHSKEQRKLGEEGWVYAPSFGSSSISPKERSLDWTRWRLWRRKIIQKCGTIRAAVLPITPTGKPRTPPGYFMAKSSSDGQQIMLPPKAYITIPESHQFQLRAYIFEARNLLPANQDGFSDPFAVVSCAIDSLSTEVCQRTLTPRWDQTIVLDGILAVGPIADVTKAPPPVLVEIFSQNQLTSSELLGRCRVTPRLCLSPDETTPPVELEWFKIHHPTGVAAGELLAAFELIRMVPDKELPIYPPIRGNIYQVPSGIRPVLGRTAVEILCWGVRNMRRYQLVSVNSPSLNLELGGTVKESPIIRDLSATPNFSKPALTFDMALPIKAEYMPPLNIEVCDNRRFGRRPVVGTCSIYDVRTHTRTAIEERWFAEPRTLVRLLRRFRTSVFASTSAVGSLGKMSRKKRSSRQSPVVQAETALSEGIDKLKLVDNDAQSIVADEPQKEQTPSIAAVSSTAVNTADIDFWSRYYASIPGREEMAGVYAELGLDKLVVYPCELEKVPLFGGFSDFCDTFSLKKGRKFEADKRKNSTGDDSDDEAGELKATLCVYPLPDSPTEPVPEPFFIDSILPPTTPVDCLCRLYLLEAVDLQPTDANGLADPFVEIEIGSHTFSSRNEYVPNSLNPVFGKMFEFTVKIPVEKDLHLRVRDYDLIGGDDIIGETVIDLENRFMSHHRGTVGLAKTYLDRSQQGGDELENGNAGSNPLVWRDFEKPSDILKAVCQRRRMGPLIYPDRDTIKIGDRVLKRSFFPQRPANPLITGPTKKSRKQCKNHQIDTIAESTFTSTQGGIDEQFCLDVLNLFELVPEHIERRPLFSETQPGVEQGRIHCWLDMFPGPPPNIPAPRDIRPRRPVPLELRCVIWNTKDVILSDTSLSGEKSVDIYVKAWLKGQEADIQSTDVHYRSMDGDGLFNWRFIFNFNYLTAERRIVVKKKEHFWSVDETEMKFAPVLVVQVWDNDQFSADDFLGQVELSLTAMPKPAKDSDQCKLTQLPQFGGDKAPPPVNLFAQKRLKGFWPVFGDESGSGSMELTGKVEMEVELLSEDDAKEKPAARAREEPNANPNLPPPNRPETSFMDFANPLKAFNFAIWRKFKYHVIMGLIIALLFLLIFLGIYSFPGALVNRIVNPRS